MMKLTFSKYSAAGNDFVLIDRQLNNNFSATPDKIEYLCDRNYGIGSDGVLVVSDNENYDFEMEYFNSDGSTGMLCGNGARSSIHYADLSGRIENSKTQFLFQSEIYSGEVIEKELIRFNLNNPTLIQRNITVSVLNESFIASFINTGAYHLVVDIGKQKFNKLKINNLDEFPVDKFGRTLRYHDKFEPPGANVNFIVRHDDIIKIRTYERGVEKETLACGTGSVASAIISYLDDKLSLPINVQTVRGEILVVDFDLLDNGDIVNVTLTGPVKKVFEGEISL